MDELEKVERLREKAQVTYEEAKEALEKNNWDLLDAMVYLEKQGKVKEPEQASYTTRYEESEKFEEAAKETQKTDSGFGAMMNRFFDWCRRVIQKGNETMFLVERDNKNLIRLPVTLFVIIGIFAFWILFWVMLVGLFVGCRYSFEGIDKVQVNVNKAMDRAAETAESIKNEFKDKCGGNHQD